MIRQAQAGSSGCQLYMCCITEKPAFSTYLTQCPEPYSSSCWLSKLKLQHVLDVTSTQLAVHTAGNLQQQAAAAGAIQAIAYCPTMGPAFARTVAANGAIHPLVDMLTRGPVAMRCAAAGALCNLSLGCPDNQVPICVLHILRCQLW